jgi:hypothetical protein
MGGPRLPTAPLSYGKVRAVDPAHKRNSPIASDEALNRCSRTGHTGAFTRP